MPVGEKTLFCTGAGGFIGRYILSHYLEKEECDVYLLENGRFRERLEHYLDEQVRARDAGCRSAADRRRGVSRAGTGAARGCTRAGRVTRGEGNAGNRRLGNRLNVFAGHSSRRYST